MANNGSKNNKHLANYESLTFKFDRFNSAVTCYALSNIFDEHKVNMQVNEMSDISL